MLKFLFFSLFFLMHLENESYPAGPQRRKSPHQDGRASSHISVTARPRSGVESDPGTSERMLCSPHPWLGSGGAPRCVHQRLRWTQRLFRYILQLIPGMGREVGGQR